jgi:hypothetical protein
MSNKKLYKHIGEAILHQDYKPSNHSIIHRINRLTEKEELDDFFISLSGYSLTTLLKPYETEVKKSRKEYK